MKYQAVCTDIDGTLLNAERELSARTLAAFGKMQPGMPVILASSRMPAAMRHLQAELNILEHALICYNGGYVIRPGEDAPEVSHSAEISLAACRAALELSQGTEVHVSLYHADEWYVPAMDYWAKREQNNTKVTPTVAALSEVLEDWEQRGVGAHKIMLMGPEEDIDQVTAGLSDAHGNELNLYRSKPTYLEIADRSINKAIGLEILLQRMYPQLSVADIIAFGDNYNDMELLEAVGLGIAVDNAKPEVIKIANEVTAAGKADGVAIAMEKYFQS